MKRFFLYRLFAATKPWFIFCILFILLYSFFFFKKMDTVFTPYNGMFAFVNAKADRTSTVAIKLNNTLVPYTGNLWWKKDFFENVIAFYSRYLLNGKQVPLHNYIKQKPLSAAQKEFLNKRLTPDSAAVKSFTRKLLRFANKNVTDGTTLEFIKYDFTFSDHRLLLTDSTSILKINVANGDRIN
ncbi:MAG: hypothetical protein ACKVOM_04750 [Ferruginibacter sp.]